MSSNCLLKLKICVKRKWNFERNFTLSLTFYITTDPMWDRNFNVSSFKQNEEIGNRKSDGKFKNEYENWNAVENSLFS